MRLPVPAREEAEQREHKDHDQDDPENTHALSSSLAVDVDLAEEISALTQRKTPEVRYAG